jgi:hypothetical protein
MWQRAWMAALAVWAIAVAGLLFYTHPLVWPDEATFGDTAWSLSQGRGFAAPALAPLVPEAGDNLLWQPPVHTLLVAAAFRVFGPSVEAMRVLSILAAVLALAAAWVLASRIGGRMAALVAVTLLLVDARVLRVALVGRMDMLTIALTLWAFCARGGLASGVLAGLAACTHPAGVIAIAASGLHLLIARSGLRMLLRFAAGVAIGLAPWAMQIALDPAAFAAQFAAQLARVSAPESSALRQITWNLDPRWFVGAVLWLAIAAGVAMLLRVARERTPASASARPLAIATLLALLLNLRRPEVMYVAWLMVPASIGLAAWASRAMDRARTRMTLATAAVAALVLVDTAYMSARIVTSRQFSYTAYAAAVGRCAVEPAPDGTAMMIVSLPEVYLDVIAHRDRLRLYVPSPTATDAQRRALFANLDAVLIGPLAHDPLWPGLIAASRAEWTTVQLREAGGYRASLAMRAGREFAIPGDCR